MSISSISLKEAPRRKIFSIVILVSFCLSVILFLFEFVGIFVVLVFGLFWFFCLVFLFVCLFFQTPLFTSIVASFSFFLLSSSAHLPAFCNHLVKRSSCILEINERKNAKVR